MNEVIQQTLKCFNQSTLTIVFYLLPITYQVHTSSKLTSFCSLVTLEHNSYDALRSIKIKELCAWIYFHKLVFLALPSVVNHINVTLISHADAGVHYLWNSHSLDKAETDPQ